MEKRFIVIVFLFGSLTMTAIALRFSVFEIQWTEEIPVSNKISWYSDVVKLSKVEILEDEYSNFDYSNGESPIFEEARYRTFVGVDEDGRIAADENGQLIVDGFLKDWFNFYFSLVGELTEEETIKVISNKIDELPYPAGEQAHEILQGYISYYSDLIELNETIAMSGESIDYDSVLAYRDKQRRIRRIRFSPIVVDQFFREQELVEDFLLDNIPPDFSEADYSLSDLSEEQKKALDIEGQYITSGDHSGMSNNIDNLTGRIGAERRQWNRRIDLYNKYRDSMMTSGYSHDELSELYSDYETEHFSTQERKRLEAALFLHQQAMSE